MKRVRFQQKYIQNQQSKEENPLFKDVRKSQKKKAFFITGGVSIGVFFSVLAGLYSPLTLINTVKVSGLTTIPVSEMKDVTYEWMGSHILGWRNRVPFFKRKSLEKHLMERYVLDEVTVTREGLSLEIVGKERASEVLLQESAEQFHLIDLEGKKTISLTREEFDSNPRIAQPTVPVFIFYDATDFSSSDQFLTEINISEMLSLNSRLHASDWVPKQYLMQSPDAEWYEIIVDDGFHIRIDGGLESESTFNAISTAIKSIDSERLSNIEYLDVRFGNNIYFKER